jgi:hypothetical protein
MAALDDMYKLYRCKTIMNCAQVGGLGGGWAGLGGERYGGGGTGRGAWQSASDLILAPLCHQPVAIISEPPSM